MTAPLLFPAHCFQRPPGCLASVPSLDSPYKTSLCLTRCPVGPRCKLLSNPPPPFTPAPTSTVWPGEITLASAATNIYFQLLDKVPGRPRPKQWPVVPPACPSHPGHVNSRGRRLKFTGPREITGRWKSLALREIVPHRISVAVRGITGFTRNQCPTGYHWLYGESLSHKETCKGTPKDIQLF